MVEYQEAAPGRLDTVFHALGDATRRRMLQALAAGECTVGQLAAPFAMSLAAASKHVRTLEQAGLVRREVRGRTHLCRLDAAPLADAHGWLAAYEEFWTRRLDVLERLLRQADSADAAGAALPGNAAATPPTAAQALSTAATAATAAPATPARPRRRASPSSDTPRPARKKGSRA